MKKYLKVSLEKITYFSFELKNESSIHSGELELGQQFHFSMEPQTTFCFPNDDGGINVYSAAQWFDLVHIALSKCLKMPQSKIFGSFKRIGGSYGAKVSRASHVACACALACHLTRRPVRFVMNIESNMAIMGKRYASIIEYEATIDSTTGHLVHFAPTITQDFGCSMNDDTAFFMIHALNETCYARRNEWKILMNRLKTDAASSTWCRAPGTTEATAIQENLMEHIARETGIDPAQVRLNNLNSSESLHKVFPEFLKDVGNVRFHLKENFIF